MNINICRIYPDWLLKIRYKKIGLTYGCMVSYGFLGEPIGYDKIKSKIINLEKEWVRRGYIAVSGDEWVTAGGYGCLNIDSILKKCMI